MSALKATHWLSLLPFPSSTRPSSSLGRTPTSCAKGAEAPRTPPLFARFLSAAAFATLTSAFSLSTRGL
eukprot:3531542-Lingulodinium_polyedra.AAC.1